MQVVQTEYMVGYALVFAMVLLGLLVICIPRPRKRHLIEPEQEQKQGRKNYKIRPGKKSSS